MAIIGKAFAEDLIGDISNPYTQFAPQYAGLGGVGAFITNVLRLLFVAAGIYALFNFVMAGFEYINAGGDSKKLDKAWARIWQSLLGLIIIVASFAMASLFGYLVFGNANFILNPVIYGPGNF